MNRMTQRFRSARNAPIAIPLLLLHCGGCSAMMSGSPGTQLDLLAAPMPMGDGGTTNDPPPGVASIPTPGEGLVSCDGPLFIDGIAAWTEVTVSGGGMDAIRQAIEGSDRARPTRITIAAGTYQGQCLYVTDHLRSAAAPLWIRGDGKGAVQIDCRDGNGQAIALEHSSYIALDGLTVGPERGYYGDSAIHISGSVIGQNDPAHYGQWQAAHHIIVRNLTARNLNRGPDGDSNPDAYESGCCDGVKSNQAEFVWVLGSHISRTARHGIDNVGVHHAAFCRNVLTDMVGAGHGMEAKGGSRDVIFEGNLVDRARHRALMLGGEGTNDVFMWPTGAAFEGERQVARGNVFLNANEGFGFYGCSDCAAIGNTLWFSAGYRLGDDFDFLRLYPSILEAGGDDYWGGSKRVGEVMRNRRLLVANNLFGAASAGLVTCTINAQEGSFSELSLKNNLWWSGAPGALPDCGSGATSLASYPDAASSFGTRDPKITDGGSFGARAPVLVPRPGSPLIGGGVAHALAPLNDMAGKRRPTPPSIGAYEP